MLKVKRLHEKAKLPTVAHPGEDIAYDLYALEDVTLECLKVTKVKTGIAAQAYDPYGKPLGLLIRDRSSVASKGAVTTGGVIDAGYTGEISVLMTYVSTIRTLVHHSKDLPLITNVVIDSDLAIIKAGDKIAQMVPVPVLTGEVVEVKELSRSTRGEKGFGSSGNL